MEFIKNESMVLNIYYHDPKYFYLSTNPMVYNRIEMGMCKQD